MKDLRRDTEMKNYFESANQVIVKFPGINVRADECVYSHLMFVIESGMMEGLKFSKFTKTAKEHAKIDLADGKPKSPKMN